MFVTGFMKKTTTSLHQLPQTPTDPFFKKGTEKQTAKEGASAEKQGEQ